MNTDPLLYLGDPPHSKRCSRCRKYKKMSEYRSQARAIHGVTAACNECMRASERKYKSPEDRFWKTFHAKTVRTGECLEWRGFCYNDHPAVRLHGKDQMVRRVVYRLAIGELRDDERIVTTCRNQRCVQHAHLQKLTYDEYRAYVANNAPTGDANGSRIHPERLVRGTMHHTYQHPDEMARVRAARNGR